MVLWTNCYEVDNIAIVENVVDIIIVEIDTDETVEIDIIEIDVVENKIVEIDIVQIVVKCLEIKNSGIVLRDSQ